MLVVRIMDEGASVVKLSKKTNVGGRVARTRPVQNHHCRILSRSPKVPFIPFPRVISCRSTLRLYTIHDLVIKIPKKSSRHDDRAQLQLLPRTQRLDLCGTELAFSVAVQRSNVGRTDHSSLSNRRSPDG